MAKRRTYTMRDVARLAGVSVSTVSAVVNKKGIVSPELSAVVQKAIDVAGFSPNRSARYLRLRQTHVIGLVVQDITNTYFVEMLRGVEDEAISLGYEVIVCNSNDQPEQEMRHLQALKDQRVDGILLAPTDSYAARGIMMREDLAPIVFVDCVPIQAEVDSVTTNNFEAAEAALRYLMQLGHRRIAVITGKPVHSSSIERLEGCRHAVQGADINLIVRQGDSKVESGYTVAMELLQSNPKPTAFFALNTRMALGVLRAFKELHIRWPYDVSIMCFGNPDWAGILDPGITTIAQPTYEIGRAAVQLLIRSIESSGKEKPPGPQQVRLDSTMHVRESPVAAPNLRPTPVGAT